MNVAALDRPLAPNAPLPNPPGESIGRLQALLRKNRRRWRALIALEALGWAVALPLAYLWLVFLLDSQHHLPLLGRLLASIGVVAGLVWAVRHLVQRWRQLQLSEDAVALAIEARTPGRIHNRLINAVQLARSSSAEGRKLSDAVIQENYDRLQQVQLEQAARLRPAILRVGLALAMIGLGVSLFLWEPARFANSAARIFLPLAPIDPLYRTRLEVEPGDIEAAGDVPLHINIYGERPRSLTILKQMHGKVAIDEVAIEAAAGPVTYMFSNVTQTVVYAVRGGDYTTPYYQITVPQKIALARMRVTYQYPTHTGLPDKTADSASGDLEALQGSRAHVAFRLDQPADRVDLVMDPSTSTGPKGASTALQRSADGKEFTGEIGLVRATGYRLDVLEGARTAQPLGPFAVRVLKDQEPKLELTGIEQHQDVQVDSVLALKIVASDDFGLEKVGLWMRRASLPGGPEAPWEPVTTWEGGKRASLRVSHDLAMASLNVAEADRIELALRATDTDPARRGNWTTGAIYEISVDGEATGLQRQYEQIVGTNDELKQLIKSQEAQLTTVIDWLRKLDGNGDLRWDDPKNIEALHRGVLGQMTAEQALQKQASQTARSMPAQAGNVRIGLGLLADTEMTRAQRIFDSVPNRDRPQAKRAALADARLTQERIVRSLQDLAEQYAGFRADWELANMVPFAKMLAERQAKMRDNAKKVAAAPVQAGPGLHVQSMARRQSKVLELCKLIEPAFAGIAARLKDIDGELGNAYSTATATLASDALLQPMQRAIVNVQVAHWEAAAREQAVAAEILSTLHQQLRAAQLKAARNALAALKVRAKTDLEAQKELESLKPGSADAFVKDYPDGFKVEDMVRVWEVNGKKSGTNPIAEPDFKKSVLMDYDKDAIELKQDSGVRQDPYVLKLGTKPEPTMPLANFASAKEKNKVKPFIQEQFDDLVGKLLDEADELHKDYQSINLSTNQNNNDPGEVGKIGGALNSTGAVAATGNKKPPTLESGGVARTGRQGARAYGMVADDDTFNRKGRDQALEGQGEVADQAGKNKMKQTDENQVDTSTGVGGKKIDSDDTHFSLHDAGKWKDEYAKRLEKPQKKEYLVERQGDKIDAKAAAQLRDLTSKQEQVIERLKSIKKELKNLYLPTEHLDELAAALQTNLESLKERPDPEMFRLQVQALDRLRGALRLFQSASAGFQPSLPRDRVVRGRVLDEPDRPALPGYEEAVRQYYRKLATK